MKTIYILLTRTRTMLSRIIHAATGDGYTHSSIALDRQLSTLYSFARKQPLTPLPAGLVHENLHTAVYARNRRSRCALYSLQVTEAQHQAIQTRIDAMLHATEPYKYSMLGMLLCKLDFVHHRHHHMFCSQFVASLLEETGAVALPKPPSLMRPIDFTGMSALQCCYEGPLEGCDTWWRRRDRPRIDSVHSEDVYCTGR